MNSSSTGRRAVVLAGRYWSQPASSPAPQRRMFRPPRRLVSSNAAGDGSKTVAWAQLQEDATGPLTTQDRHLRSHRTLIYRDVKAFLKEIGGDPREARYWLTQFQRASAAHAPAFAVLEVNSESLGFIEMQNYSLYGADINDRKKKEKSSCLLYRYNM